MPKKIGGNLFTEKWYDVVCKRNEYIRLVDNRKQLHSVLFTVREKSNFTKTINFRAGVSLPPV